MNLDAEGRSLTLAPGPSVRLVNRDPQAALETFLKNSPPQLTEDEDGSSDAIVAENWYHTIELPDGRVTRGRYDHRPLVPYYGLPDSMAGMRALDVGTADGFWAFEMERRGADVVAVEVPRLSDRDFPALVKRLVAEQADTPPGRRFKWARRELGSSVELARIAINDMTPERVGTFDFVHVGDVLLHLRDPAGGLAAIRSITSGQAHIGDVVHRSLENGDQRNLASYLGGWTSTTWWTPSVQTLAQMTIDAGFSEVELLGLYQLQIRGGGAPWRAVLRATA